MNLAINVTFVGITVVFTSLIVLSLIVFLFSKLLSLKSFRVKKRDNIDIKYNASDIKIKENYISNKPDNCNVLKDELVAVITSSILAGMSTTPGCRIRIKSFKRIPQTSPVWNRITRKG